MPPRGTDPKKLQRWTRQSRAFELRLAGNSYEQISEIIRGEYNLETYGSNRAHEDVTAILKQKKDEQSHSIEELRLLEAQRYEKYIKALDTKIEKGDVQAVATACKVSERRAKLWGLDAPIQLQVEEIVSNELSSILDAIQPFLTADTYKQVLNAIATVTSGEGAASRN